MIRDATLADVPRLVEMGQRFLSSSSYRGQIAENPEQMARIATKLIESPDGAVFVSEVSGAVTGMIGLFAYAHPISDEVIASELFWYVEPEHRGSGVRLLREAERWARAGTEKIQMIAPTPEVEHLYERLGYQRVETAYQKGF